MIDIIGLLKTTNLRSLIERDTVQSTAKRLFCPFCQAQHTGGPAMQIFGERFHCFGCGAHGDGINYIQQRDGVNFLEACRRLGWNGGTSTPDEIKTAQAERERVQVEQEQVRAAKLDDLLAEFSLEEIWLAYHRRMGDEQIAWWETQGIPQSWQNYLQLGFIPRKAYYNKAGELQFSPAYSIPYLHQGKFLTMQYRLQDAIDPRDRYRFESGLKTTYYMVQHTQPIPRFAIICEGAKKAAVVQICGDLRHDVTVLGIPSKTDFGGVAEAVKDCERAWIVPDPDAWDKPAHAPADWLPSPIKLGRQIGKAARIASLPVKVDDGFLDNMTAGDFACYLRQARPV